MVITCHQRLVLAIITFLLAIFFLGSTAGEAQQSSSQPEKLQSIVSHGCPKDQLHRCVRIAEPLLRNPDYVFPSTPEDVGTVCRLWSEFSDCVRGYATTCLTGDRGREIQLHGALDEAGRSVDEMCTNMAYQADYLRHAPCIKSMATDDGKCRKQLGHLVDLVSALSISNVQVCCAHHSFRECMLSATYRYCRTPQDGSAVQFSRDMFSKSLAFLLKQCEDYVPNSSDCPAAGVTSQDFWETPVRPNDLQPAGMTTTWAPASGTTSSRRRDFIWSGSQNVETTYRPWFPGGSNSLDSPKQQSLFSGSPSSSHPHGVRGSALGSALLLGIIFFLLL